MSKFMQVLNNQITNVTDRKNFATVTVAISVAYALSIPEEKEIVNSPYAYFDNVYEEHVKKVLCELNEECVISVNDALELTRKLWVQRYNLIYKPTSINPITLVAAVTAADEQSVGSEFISFSNSVKVASSVLINEATAMVERVTDMCNKMPDKVIDSAA